MHQKPRLGEITRRKILGTLAGLGVGSGAWRRALALQVEQSGAITAEMLREADWIAGLELSDEDRERTAGAVQRTLQRIRELREVEVDYDVPPALYFSTPPWRQCVPGVRRNQAAPLEFASLQRPLHDGMLAFLPVAELAALLRSRQVTSTELTKLYLLRLRKYNSLLNCVVSYMDDRAMELAARADREIAAGIYRGPLHGVPWGAKDLIGYPGCQTTWGAPAFKNQIIDDKATVAHRLEDAGAVLIAKLSLGALAQGDKWFQGQTKNPWDPRQGSSGSSAGSASAVAAGLVGFALGSETLGSIVSPCKRCGSTGLRPTFGRVSRHGCMALSWSMDKIGPITRSVEDCALVLDAIHGYDGLDPTAIDQHFAWPSVRELRELRVGYVKDEKSDDERPELEVLSDLGVQLVPLELPKEYPASAVAIMLDTEAACAFEDLTRRGVTEGLNNWPTAFRKSHYVSAVDYLRASRVRTLLMREMEELFRKVDLYVGGDDLVITNLTGHPTVVLPDGFMEHDGRRVPTAITFTGRLFGESDLLAVAQAYQQATGHHLKRPPLDEFLSENDSN